MRTLITITLFALYASLSYAQESAINRFLGHYQGETKVTDTRSRNLEVDIKPIDEGFNVSWKTITHESDGSGKTKSYSIDFINSDREGIYGSAMKANLFGGQQALDPIKGEPYFWAKISGDNLTIFGMLITADGDYEIQRYERILQGEELVLNYSLIRNEQVLKTVNATLTRKN